MDFFVKNTNAQIRGKISGFVNTNPREFKNLYILLEFINTEWIDTNHNFVTLHPLEDDIET